MRIDTHFQLRIAAICLALWAAAAGAMVRNIAAQAAPTLAPVLKPSLMPDFTGRRFRGPFRYC